MRLLGVLIMAVFLVMGCATGEIIKSDFREGMTKQDVISKLGNPDGFKRSGEFEYFQYTNRVISGWGMDRTDYTMVFKDERLVGWSSGEVRNTGPKTHNVMLWSNPFSQ